MWNRKKKFYVADPGKGLVIYNLDEFKKHWISTKSNGEDKGFAMFLEATPAFSTYKMEGEVSCVHDFWLVLPPATPEDLNCANLYFPEKCLATCLNIA